MSTRKRVTRFPVLAALPLLLISTISAATETSDEALSAYQQGDYDVALQGFRRAAEQGEADAQFILGSMYDRGEGVLQDYAEAAKWWRRAAEQGHVFAQISLGELFRNGEGVLQDYAEAVKWFRRAAKQGQVDAQLVLADMYSNGHGVPQDEAEAARWFRRAAEQGDASAQFTLGNMYRNGQGVPQDYAEAARWFRQAAERGDAPSQFNLALMYHRSEGTVQDHTQAVKWYRHAAEQGLPEAQNNLGFMYETGKGVAQNLIQALKWYNLAAARYPASTRRDLAVRKRDRVVSQLTPDELAKAQRLAREWRPGTPAPAADAHDANIGIEDLQHALRELGYEPGPIDGILGTRTRAAIRAFQIDRGLPVTGEVSDNLRTSIALALVPATGEASDLRISIALALLSDQSHTPISSSPPRALERKSTGSGFRITTRGHVLTNAHVVRECAEVRIPPKGIVQVAARDNASDLALLQAPAGTAHVSARFRQGRGIRPGANILVVGYPLRGLVASGTNVSTGAVSALVGPGDDRSLIQITAPVQPGNSGGPVLDAGGNVVGVVVGKLDAIKVATSTGDIPQNVNFAVSAGAVRAFLDDEGIPYETAPSDKTLELVEVAATAKEYTVLVECWN